MVLKFGQPPLGAAVAAAAGAAAGDACAGNITGQPINKAITNARKIVTISPP
jgi:hypothetical protein